METAEDIRYTLGMKALYDQRKETIERIFGTAKEYHGFRYTNMIGKARMTMKAALTFSCINLKKLAKMMDGKPSNNDHFSLFSVFFSMIQDSLRYSAALFLAAKQNGPNA